MKHCRVLVVDDSPVFLKSARLLLASLPGIETVGEATSGRNALEMAARLLPDLVLMDLVMPETGGLEATRTLSAQPGGPAIVLMTLYDHPGYREAANAAGADAFITKSDLGDHVLPLIRRLMNEREEETLSRGESPHPDRFRDRTDSEPSTDRRCDEASASIEPTFRDSLLSAGRGSKGKQIVIRITEPENPAARPAAPGRGAAKLGRDDIDTLGRLLDSLGSLAGDPTSYPAAAASDRGKNADYVYLEARLPGRNRRDVDINVHDGRVLIRVAR